MSRVSKYERKARRAKGIKFNLSANTRPRLTVFRSLKHIYAQIINDETQVTIASASTNDKEFKTQSSAGNKCNASKAVGMMLAKRALQAGVKSVAFDRNGYLYHGRVKSLADGAREAGLDF
ncbi:MAG: 50S ribosomal protein L18 [Candidatus Kapabacteria bacterium]|nr:50S ribosomal protein L18 [Candidatus Kapabacteria bacterium]MBX7153790.1 50S ribosomal protein L18 [Bacteroidota bacterium]